MGRSIEESEERLLEVLRPMQRAPHYVEADGKVGVELRVLNRVQIARDSHDERDLLAQLSHTGINAGTVILECLKFRRNVRCVFDFLNLVFSVAKGAATVETYCIKH